MLANTAFPDFAIVEVFDLAVLLLRPIAVPGRGDFTIIGVLVFMDIAMACQFVPKCRRRLWTSFCSGTDQ